jgi:hypothetical protein
MLGSDGTERYAGKYFIQYHFRGIGSGPQVKIAHLPFVFAQIKENSFEHFMEIVGLLYRRSFDKVLRTLSEEKLLW